MTSRTPRPTYMRTSEVAGLLHVSPKTVSRWAQEGKLPFLRTLGGHRRYPDDEIRALVDSLRGQGETERAAILDPLHADQQ